MNIKIITVLFLVCLTFSAFSQEKTKQKENVVTKKTQSTNNTESSNPLDFGYEKKVVNGKEVYINKNNKSNKLTIVYVPKEN